MSIVAAVKRAIGYGSDHWKLELPEAEQKAAYFSEVLDGQAAWLDNYRMECAEKYVSLRRIYQTMSVFDI